MGKRLIHDYTFTRDSSDGTKGSLILNEIVTQDRLLMITNVTDGETLFTFNDPTNKVNSISFQHEPQPGKTTIQLAKNTSNMTDYLDDSANPDKLQIFIEDNETTVDLSETFIDPVAKIRVSQPENLIDTDFEYGLQSSKWETLELVKNIPTFFSRNGDIALTATSMTVIAGSDNVNVTCTEEHGLARGTPIIVQGTKDILADGGYVVTGVSSNTVFTYKAKGIFQSSKDIFDTYTQVFSGNLYQGTEFDLEGIGGITTDQGSPTSKLTVSTQYPTNFTPGTSFFLANSFAKSQAQFLGDSTGITINEVNNVIKSTGAINVATNETTLTDPHSGFQLGVLNPYAFEPADISECGLLSTCYFKLGDATIDQSNNTIDVGFAHGLPDLTLCRVFEGEGNTLPTGLTERNYYLQVINTTTLAFSTRRYAASTTTYRANLSSNGTDGGISKVCVATGLTNYYIRNTGYLYFDNVTRAHFGYNNTTAVAHLSPVTRWGVHTTNSTVLSRTDNGFNGGAIPDGNLQQIPEGGQGGTGKHIYFPYGSTSRTNNTNYTYYWMRMARTQDGGTNYYRPSASIYMTDYSPDGNEDANNQQLILAYKEVSEPNSFYIPNHGFTTGDIVSFSSTGTLPTGLAGLAGAQAVKTSDNRFKFTQSGSALNITAAGTTTQDISFNAVSLNTLGNSINLVGNSMSNGEIVTYTNNGASNIGGLTSGTNYFVFDRTTDTIKLATTLTGFTGDEVLIDTKASSPNANTAIINSTSGRIEGVSSTAGINSFVDGSIVKIEQVSGSTAHGLKNGAYLFVDQINTKQFDLYPTDSDRVAGTNKYVPARTASDGSVRLKETTLVDLTSFDSGLHSVTANFIGAADAVYSLDSNLGDSGTRFTISATNNQVLRRTLTYNANTNVSYEHSAFRIEKHGLMTGNTVTVGNPNNISSSLFQPAAIDSAGTYFVKRLNDDWFRLSNNLDSARDSANIGFINFVSGQDVQFSVNDFQFTSNNVVGETEGPGILTLTENSNVVLGENTNFTSSFNKGDRLNLFYPEVKAYSVGGDATAADNTVTPNGGVGYLTTGQLVVFTDNGGVTQIVVGRHYYARVLTGGSFGKITLHPSSYAATNNSGAITLSSSTTGDVDFYYYTSLGSTVEKTINYVNSPTKLELMDNVAVASDSAAYSINSALLVRADGFALHRPYDGGVELIPPTNPDSRMIRQTRKYFRYQSGKGIQVSYAVNFKPTVDMDAFTRSGNVGTITTRFPHRINIADSSDNIFVKTSGATNGDASTTWNGLHKVIEKTSEYQFNVRLPSTPSDASATGLSVFNVNEWSNCSLRCGLFDDQNGLFFEYDGQELSCVVRNSIKQISGTVTATFKSGDINGLNTKFTTQVAVGQDIVIKGQSYTITKISSDTLLHILPSYRGVTQNNIIVTKVDNNRVSQANWNLDKCDGTGTHGFKLELNKIQMAYIDYSWYGAGKVRFGFKDQKGVVRYVHEFVHGNTETEAYMRSGNMPARYELQNIGKPTYVPALAHWGTSVIMDGGFDDDKAYVFTASSLNNTYTVGSTIDANGRIETTSNYQTYVGGWRNMGPGILLSTGSINLNQAVAGQAAAGGGSYDAASNGLASNTVLANPITSYLDPNPYQPSIFTRISGQGRGSQATRNLLLLDRAPAGTTNVDSDYTVTVATGGDTNLSKDFPIISIRLSPSVDTNTPGFLGEREIINRMQLILNEVDVLTTHGVVVELRFNPQLDNNAWQRVTNPSLSQLIYHGATDTITGGTTVFSFNAEGSDNTTRAPVLTAKTLSEVATLGNAIMGGDNIFPDGPDVLTVVGKLREDISTVTVTNPFQLQGRISWAESQA